MVSRYIVGPFLSDKILYLIVFVVIFVSALLSVKKEKKESFNVTILALKSLSQEKLKMALESLEPSEQQLIMQRFNIKKKFGIVKIGNFISIYDLAYKYNMEYKELKDWLTFVDNKLFNRIQAK